VLIYSALFCIGEICFGRYGQGLLLGCISIVCAIVISRLMPKASEWLGS
jgi:hypothetical protein